MCGLLTHHHNNPHAPIARILPGQIIRELIDLFDINNQALGSPLAPPVMAHNDEKNPLSFYKPEITSNENDYTSFLENFKALIDNPSSDK